MKILLSFLLLLNTYSSQEISADIRYRALQVSIVDQEVAKAIFIRLPVRLAPAQLVHGLIFKNGRYLFCVREPTRNYHCHFYLKGHGEGKLSSFWSDKDYGKGSFLEYLESESVHSNARIKVVKENLLLNFEGAVATKLFDRLDLAKVVYGNKDGLRYEKRTGHSIKCVRAERLSGDNDACQVFVPLGKSLEEKKIETPLLF